MMCIAINTCTIYLRFHSPVVVIKHMPGCISHGWIAFLRSFGDAWSQSIVDCRRKMKYKRDEDTFIFGYISCVCRFTLNMWRFVRLYWYIKLWKLIKTWWRNDTAVEILQSRQRKVNQNIMIKVPRQTACRRCCLRSREGHRYFPYPQLLPGWLSRGNRYPPNGALDLLFLGLLDIQSWVTGLSDWVIA